MRPTLDITATLELEAANDLSHNSYQTSTITSLPLRLPPTLSFSPTSVERREFRMYANQHYKSTFTNRSLVV